MIAKPLLLAIVHGLIAAAEIGLKEHDRLAVARTMIERKLEGRRTSSKLPNPVELVIETAGVGWHGGGNARGDAAGGAADCQQARTQRDDRGRFRAWGVM